MKGARERWLCEFMCGAVGRASSFFLSFFAQDLLHTRIPASACSLCVSLIGCSLYPLLPWSKISCTSSEPDPMSTSSLPSPVSWKTSTVTPRLDPESGNPNERREWCLSGLKTAFRPPPEFVFVRWAILELDLIAHIGVATKVGVNCGVVGWGGRGEEAC